MAPGDQVGGPAPGKGCSTGLLPGQGRGCWGAAVSGCLGAWTDVALNGGRQCRRRGLRRRAFGSPRQMARKSLTLAGRAGHQLVAQAWEAMRVVPVQEGLWIQAEAAGPRQGVGAMKAPATAAPPSMPSVSAARAHAWQAVQGQRQASRYSTLRPPQPHAKRGLAVPAQRDASRRRSARAGPRNCTSRVRWMPHQTGVFLQRPAWPHPAVGRPARCPACPIGGRAPAGRPGGSARGRHGRWVWQPGSSGRRLERARWPGAARPIACDQQARDAAGRRDAVMASTACAS